MMKLILSCLLVLSTLPLTAQAQNGGDLEWRVRQLERKLSFASERISILENEVFRTNPLPPPSPARTEVVCALVESGWSKTYIGKGRNKIDAQANVLSTCGKETNSSFCNGGKMTCSSGVQEPGVNGYICVLKDSGWGKVYRGEAKTALEAEALAKQSCQSANNASYCGNVKATCEAW